MTDNVPELASGVADTPLKRWNAIWHHWSTEVGYAIILYCSMIGGVIHVILTPAAEKMRVGEVPTTLGYLAWEICGILAFIMFVTQWMLRLFGRSYIGLTLRLMANILLSTVMWCVWVARVNADFPFKDVNIFTNYIFVGVCLFTVALIGRDIWVLFFRKAH